MRYEYMIFTRTGGTDTINELNILGFLRWRLVSVDGMDYYLIREIPEVGVKLPEPQVRATA